MSSANALQLEGNKSAVNAWNLRKRYNRHMVRLEGTKVKTPKGYICEGTLILLHQHILIIA